MCSVDKLKIMNYIIYVSVNSKLDHLPRAKPPGNFLMGEFPTPGKKRAQNPRPRAYKNELKPHPRGHFPQLFTEKNETEVMQNCKILSSLDD